MISREIAFTRPPTAQEAVLEELRLRLTSGSIAQDGHILPDDIAASLGVSRGPVREALKILVGEGLVTYHAHRGYFVRKLDYSDLKEIYRIRALLEAEVIREAVPRASSELAKTLDRLCSDMEAADSESELAQLQVLNRAFHFEIFSMSGLEHFIEHLRMAWNRTDPYRALYYSSAANRECVHAEHRSIVDAIRQSDVSATVELVDSHRAKALENLQGALERLGAT